jgi:hypothetical protein
MGVFEFLFRKRTPSGAALSSGQRADTGVAPQRPQMFQIDFDMMLKGSVYPRRRGPVRQFGVTVNGSTRLVTSGDVVDRDTYNALLAAGAIRPPAPERTSPRTPASALLDYTADENIEE